MICEQFCTYKVVFMSYFDPLDNHRFSGLSGAEHKGDRSEFVKSGAGMK
jgi:hypothetical protein